MKKILLPILLLLGSCVHERIPNSSAAPGENRITLQLTVPRAAAPRTRGIEITSRQDNHIPDVLVLFFNRDNASQAIGDTRFAGLTAMRDGSQIIEYPDNPAHKTLVIDLPAKVAFNPTNTYEMAVLTGYLGTLDDATVRALQAQWLASSETFDNVMNTPALRDQLRVQESPVVPNVDGIGKSYQWRADPSAFFHMSGVHRIVPRSTPITGVELLRATARVDIDAAAVASDFTLTAVVSENMYPRGNIFTNLLLWGETPLRVIPESYHWAGIVPNPNPDALDKDDAAPGQYRGTLQGVYSGAQVKNNAVTGEIFLFEDPNIYVQDPITLDELADAPAFYIRGIRKSGPYANQVRWWRLHLRGKASNGVPLHMSIIRNHCYTLTLQDIKTDGYPTIDIARQNLPEEISYRLTVFDESSLNHAVFHNERYIASNKESISFTYNTGCTRTLRLDTNLPLPEIGSSDPLPAWMFPAVPSWLEPITAASWQRIPGDAMLLTLRTRYDNTTPNFTQTASLSFAAEGLDLRVELLFRPRHVPAPPGYLGVVMSDDPERDGQLTLRGSSEWNADPRIRDAAMAEFGGLHPDPVDLLYFGWGSMVGMRSFSADFTVGTHGADVGWAPPEFGQRNELLSAATPQNMESLYPYYRTPDANIWLQIAQNPRAGTGDPCVYADKGHYYTWRSPGFSLADGYHSMGVDVSNSELHEPTAPNLPRGLWHTSASKDVDFFFPFAGTYSFKPPLAQSAGPLEVYNQHGYIWTTYQYLSYTPWAMKNLINLNNGLMQTGYDHVTGTNKHMVRCFNTAAVPRPTFKPMKTYGWGSYENTAGYIMQPGSGTRIVADAVGNFGMEPHSRVRIRRASTASTFNHSVLSGGDSDNASKVREMFESRPDIVLTGFDLSLSSSNRELAIGYMLDYLNNHGVLIFACENHTMVRDFFQAMYPNRTIDTDLSGTAAFQVADMGDEITDGPFGNIGNKFVGNDTLGTRAVSGLPEEDLIVYARDDHGWPIVFRHKHMHLFYNGDGGAFANHAGTAGPDSGADAEIYYPLSFASSGAPITCTKWRSTPVENSRLFCNVMAWAIRMADQNGINP